MLPILDMANHAFDGEGANVAYQVGVVRQAARGSGRKGG